MKTETEKAIKIANVSMYGSFANEDFKFNTIQGILNKETKNSITVDISGEQPKVLDVPELISEILAEKIAKEKIKYTKLVVFDMDGTLLNTPLPEEGQQIYEQKTGNKWPYRGWWSKEETLDDSIFDIQPVQEVLEIYREEILNPTTLVVMLTGRRKMLASQVEKLLNKHYTKFDHHIYNEDSTTLKSKLTSLNMLLNKYPTIQHVKLLDDRKEHKDYFDFWGLTAQQLGKIEQYEMKFVENKRFND